MGDGRIVPVFYIKMWINDHMNYLSEIVNAMCLNHAFFVKEFLESRILKIDYVEKNQHLMIDVDADIDHQLIVAIITECFEYFATDEHVVINKITITKK